MGVVPINAEHDSRLKVREQWRARLPEAQLRVFDSVVGELEACYAMLSITLDDAFASRDRGRLGRAREGAAVAADLFDRLSGGLLAALGAVAEQSRHPGPVPDVTPLDPEFFRREWARRAAAWSHLMHYVLLGTRSRFLHKVEALDCAVRTLAGEFRETAAEISEGASTRPEHHWQSLDAMHYDVNTCLRETIVLLKSFLHSLPPQDVDAFARRAAGRKPAAVPEPLPSQEPAPRRASGGWT